MKPLCHTKPRAGARAFLFNFIILFVSVTAVYSQTQPTDHFRSKNSGDWDVLTTWESSVDSIVWMDATLKPTDQCSSITIMDSHEVTIFHQEKGRYITINEGGTLILDARGEFTLKKEEGPDLVVFGTLILENFIATTADIIMKSGSLYIKNITKSDEKLNYCTWEQGSTIRLNIRFPYLSLVNLDQEFYNFFIDGSDYVFTADFRLKLPANLTVNGDFTIYLNTSNKIYFTEATAPSVWNIHGDMNLQNYMFLYLSYGTAGVELNIGGDLNIGSITERVAKFGIGDVNAKNNVVRLNGNLNILNGSGLNGNGNMMNGTLHFANCLNTQEVTISGLNAIRRSNIVIDEGVHVKVNSALSNSDNTILLQDNAMLEIANFTNVAVGNLVLNDNSALITNSAVYGTMHRTLTNADWEVAQDGWHLLSSPVAAQSITSGGFLDGGYDFYKWSEDQNLWLNQKAHPEITSFTPGEGYLVAYDDGGTKTFTGAFNVTPITFTNLSKTETSPYSGFHLLGNPFPCAIDWGATEWNRNNISDVANIWNEVAMNYIPVDVSTNSIIPANQGFFVQALDEVNSLTIPLEARTFNNTAFYKNGAEPGLLWLKVTNLDNLTWDEAVIQVRQDALSVFDKSDGHEMQGSESAPQLYTITNSNEMLCVNSIPSDSIPPLIPVYFKSGVGGNFKLEVLKNTMPGPLYLEDMITGKVQCLDDSTQLHFTSSGSDNSKRFSLHTGALGLPENDRQSSIKVYSSGDVIYIKDPKGNDLDGECMVMDLSGKVMYKGDLEHRSIVKIKLGNLSTGLYLVSVRSLHNSVVFKVLINKHY
jgi:hypothetical protein